jgi:hypothetical protein
VLTTDKAIAIRQTTAGEETFATVKGSSTEEKAMAASHNNKQVLVTLALQPAEVARSVGTLLLLLLLWCQVPVGMPSSCSLDSLVPNSTNLAASKPTISAQTQRQVWSDLGVSIAAMRRPPVECE